MRENNTTIPAQPNVPSQPSCSNTVRRSPRKHNTMRMSPIKHQIPPSTTYVCKQQSGSKRVRRNSIDVPRKKLCTRRGGRRIGSAKNRNDTPTIGTQESVVQQVPTTDEVENVMQEGYNEVPVIHIQDGHMMQEAGVNFTNKTKSIPLKGDNVVEDNEVIEFIEGREEDILPEKIQSGLLDIDNMLEAGYSMAEIEAMAGVQVELDDSPRVELSDDNDVGLDGGVEGAGDEAAGDGDGDGEGNDVGDEAVGDSDGEGHSAGDVDDGDGPEGDGDGPDGGVDEMSDDEGNQGDDEGHEVIPMVRRIRKTSERITKIKLRNDVYDKYGGGSSSVNTINLE
ncbi:unnamed protein product [Lactuca virosa]|uniref:Uncharacterized protein n=1 Tax=Lactuca virosa TaxID=75947 RepID=A0AAU9LIL8_9ASTR|nr:unnamed protein product [Lactuca virosa]